jgi:hypothetical protein
MADIFLLSFKRVKIAAAKIANVRHQIVPVVIKVAPNIKKGKTVWLTAGSINWGRKAIKNNATFGFRIFVKIASRYILR